MSNDERKETVENIAEKFTSLQESDKTYIVGYMAGIQEERQRWENKEKGKEAAVATA